MRSLSFFAALSACLLPSSLMADEPARGTIVMVSSVGTWVILSSIFMLRKRKRQSESATDTTTKPDQP
ncbi:hypothetical protein Ga0100231_000525 [Opitutaceae bacterium TAV4]|nr:hypothetical protein Ga0100231_000525 [Opitutaceae bacterium TAV4]RRK01628.1 hypothetical protein Ga0100230_007240 [Opitutaceae bacterium TAV3]